MQKIYSKDECSLDALSAELWLNKHGIAFNSLKDPFIDFVDSTNEDRTRYFCFQGQYYKIIYSCRVYEDVFRASLEELNAAFSLFSTRMTIS